jgi:hypothetical protein
MRARYPNRQQYWFCKKCGCKTEHKIPDLDSNWTDVAGVAVYRRYRQCTKCFSWLRTIEIPADEFDACTAELDQLRAMRADHKRLLKALAAKQAAEAEMTRLLASTGVTHSTSTT